MNGTNPKLNRQIQTVILAMALLKLTIHLVTNAMGGYGIFRDELYYLACAARPAMGYVDQPPFSIFVLALLRPFSQSLFLLRLVPAFLGAATVWIFGRTIRRMGGGIFGVAAGCLSMIIAPIVLGMNGYYSMNSFDIFFWTLAAAFFVALLERPDPRIWLLLGLTAGLGLLNKIGMAWLIIGIFTALILTSQRRHLKTPRPYVAGALALLLFLPFIIWNIRHDWAHLEFIRRATTLKYAGLTPKDFIMGQIINMHPVNLPVWFAGLGYVFFHKEGKKFMPLGIVWIAVFLILVINGHSKAEYLAPAYPLILAPGVIFIEKLVRPPGRLVLRIAIPVNLLVFGAAITPMALPILPLETYIQYARLLGMGPSSAEGKDLAELPQHYADMFGWESMAESVSRVYLSLTPDERKTTVVFGRNYGEAGAMEYYARRYPLPPAMASHNNYWIWGRSMLDRDIRTLIHIGGDQEDLGRYFEEVIPAGFHQCRYCMPYENSLTLFICRGLRRPLAEIWESIKNFE